MIAKEILRQLNANRLRAMIGANNFCDLGNALSFRFKGSNVSNYIEIRLNSMDMYDISFMKIRGIKLKETGEFKDIGVDNMKSVIEQHTGLYLTL